MPDAPSPPLVAICTPGLEFSWMWLNAWTNFLFQFLQGHSICYTCAYSNNVYFVRNRCISEIRQALGDTIPDYLLWFDSDNLPNFVQFLILKQALIDYPEASGVGAWYYVQSGIPAGAEIAAGWYRNGGDEHVTLQQITDAKDDLIEIDYAGLGFYLMRGSLLKDMDEEPFAPLPNGKTFFPDDSSFFLRLKARNHKFYLHPRTHVPHLKLLPLVAIPNAEL